MQRLSRPDRAAGRGARRPPLIASNDRRTAIDHQIYTDGATSGNPGPSGWGAVILGGGRRKEIGGFEEHSTNNRMELTAVIESLRVVPHGANAVVHSDSAYVIDGITKYIHKWRRNDFLKADKQPVENRDLWEELDALSGPRVRYVKVAAHSGNRENERANDIAQAFSKKKRVRLVEAPYTHVNPPPSAAGGSLARGVIFPTYAVYHQGRLDFHRSWDDCRRAVEGRRGMRYKKCKTREELEYTLEKWGARAMS